jgi:ABC-type multidrug transport system fused ATPase/permease subunit
VVTDEFERIYSAFNDRSHEAAMFNLNIQWIANFIPSVATSFVMVFAGLKVIAGEMTVPAFVVFLNTMNNFGPTLSAVFMNIFHINQVLHIVLT